MHFEKKSFFPGENRSVKSKNFLSDNLNFYANKTKFNTSKNEKKKTYFSHSIIFLIIILIILHKKIFAIRKRRSIFLAFSPIKYLRKNLNFMQKEKIKFDAQNF